VWASRNNDENVVSCLELQQIRDGGQLLRRAYKYSFRKKNPWMEG